MVWIDQTQFICQLAESLLKDQEISCYTLNKCEDFGYLLKDLKPEILICDLNTIKDHIKVFKAEVKDYSGIILATSSLFEYESFKDFTFSGLIEKPLEVEHLTKKILGFVK